MPESNQQLEALLADPIFRRLRDLIAREVMARWSMSPGAARRLVLSAIGEPAVLAGIHEAWTAAERRPGLAKVIIRRRVLDLLEKDARPRSHVSFPDTLDDGEPDLALGPVDPATQRGVLGWMTGQQIIEQVRNALACFAMQGITQRRQAGLLQRYDLDEITYSQLSAELACSKNALRVRVHKARAALLKHIRGCHPELEDLLEVAAWAHST
jgi:DNA-directed RNA polymerase specialized sigma24 family protein